MYTLTEMKMSIHWLFIYQEELGVHNFTEKGLYNYIGQRTWVYCILSAFVLFITTRDAGNSFMCCSYLWKLKFGLNIHIDIPNFAQVGLNACECMPWKLHADKQGFAILQQFACSLHPELFSFWRMTADEHSVLSSLHGAGELLSLSFTYSFCRRFPVAAVIPWVGYSCLRKRIP